MVAQLALGDVTVAIRPMIGWLAGGVAAAATMAVVVTVVWPPVSVPAPQVAPGADVPAETVDTPAVPAAVTPQTLLVIEDLRVEPDGMAVVAGIAAPGEEVAILVDAEPAAQVQAGPDGRFAGILMLAPSDAPRVLTLRAGEGAAERGSDQQVVVAPTSVVVTVESGAGQAPAEEPMQVVVTRADEVRAPTDLGDPAAVEATPADLSPADTPHALADPVQAASMQGEDTGQPTDVSAVQTNTAEPQRSSVYMPDTGPDLGQPDAGAGVVGVAAVDARGPDRQLRPVLPAARISQNTDPADTAPGGRPVALLDAAVPEGPVTDAPVAVPSSELAQPVHTGQGVTNPVADLRSDPIPQPVGITGSLPEVAALAPALSGAATPVADAGDAPAPDAAGSPPVLVVDVDGVRVLQPAIGPGAVAEVMASVALDTISYDAGGEVSVAGRATRPGFVRVYINESPVAVAEIANGQWGAVLPDVLPGVYRMRVDQIDAGGTVVSRIETPFQREAREDVAAVMASQTGEGFGIAVKTVQPGHTLWAIARERYGEGVLYVEVFAANRDRIRNPDLIYPGQVFVLPEMPEEAGP